MRLLNRLVLAVPLLALAAILIGLPSVALGKNDSREFSARLIGLNEVPSINTKGQGTLKLTINDDSSIDFVLNYKDLSLAPAVAHIHFGQARTNGAVVVFFCGGGGQKACPASTSGTVTGTITADNVIAVPAQGINVNDLAAVTRFIRSGAAYANMHTPPKFGGGEIRGQIHRSSGERDDADRSED